MRVHKRSGRAVPRQAVQKEVEALNVASRVLPTAEGQARRPWISFRTLALTEKRNNARYSGDYVAEKSLNKHIKNAARVDRNI